MLTRREHGGTQPRTALVWTARALTVALGARVAVLAIRYLSGSAGVQRFHLESATVAFVIVGALLHVALSRDADGETPAHGGFRGEWVWWCAAALILYWPSLQVGLLSDDFVLADRVWHGEFGPVHRELFRPLPLLAWGALLRLRGGPVALHAVNILGHGLVAYLTSRLAMPVVPSRSLAVGAGLLVLTFPAATEAVTWASGVFDVTATLLVLSAVLVSRSYRERPDARTRVAMLACAIAALLCKETAVVTPVLIGAYAWAERRLSRALLFDVTGLASFFAAVGAVRLVFASAAIRQPITRYLLQRWVFGTVGGVAIPWHSQIVAGWVWLPVTGVLLATALATWFFVARGSAGETRAAAASAAWLLLGTLPASTFFIIAPDLQGSRFLYLSSIGYALLLAAMAARGKSVGPRVIGTGAIAVLVLTGAAGARWHQQTWRAAATLRDAILAGARTDDRLRACGVVTVRDLPDNAEGAYIFRNGAELAFTQVGLTLSDRATPSCTFRWDGGRAGFTVVGPS